MKEKVELSLKSYLESWNLCQFINLWHLALWTGFFILNLIQHLTFWNEKSHYFYSNRCCSGQELQGVNFTHFTPFCCHFTSMLPDISRHCQKNRQIVSQTTGFWGYLNLQILSGYEERNDDSMCIRHVLVEEWQSSRMFWWISLGLQWFHH